MGFFKNKKPSSLGEKIAIRLEQRGIPAIGSDSQVFVYEKATRGSCVVLSLVGDHMSNEWGGFWFWSINIKQELLTFTMKSEYRFGENDPLSIEIAFMEWIERNGYYGGTGMFLGSPKNWEEKGYQRVIPENMRYP